MKINVRESNPWWVAGSNFAYYDTQLKPIRELNSIEIKREPLSLNKGEVFLIKGPRQCGKTTFLKQQIEHQLGKNFPKESILYLSGDFLTSRELRSNLRWFFETKNSLDMTFVFLDEVTKISNWDIELKWIADTGYLQKTCVVATGSNPAAIKRAPEKAPGRAQKTKLFKPLSFREYALQLAQKFKQRNPNFEEVERVLSKNKICLEDHPQAIYQKASTLTAISSELNSLFEYFLSTGGIPKPIALMFIDYARDGTPKPIQQDIYEDLIKTTLGELATFNLRDEATRQVMHKILKNYGSKSDFSSMSIDVHESRQTISRYLSVLEDSMLVQVLYGNDLVKVKYGGHKKIYFTDPFYYHALDAYSKGVDGFQNAENNKLNDEMRGKLIEGIIANHLSLAGEEPYLRENHSFLWFYSDKNKEIDALVRDKNGQYLGIEVKTGERDKFPKVDLKKKIMLCKEELELNQAENLLYCPYSIFLALLEKTPAHV